MEPSDSMASTFLTMTCLFFSRCALPERQTLVTTGSISGTRPTAVPSANSRACVQSPSTNPRIIMTNGSTMSMHLTRAAQMLLAPVPNCVPIRARRRETGCSSVMRARTVAEALPSTMVVPARTASPSRLTVWPLSPVSDDSETRMCSPLARTASTGQSIPAYRRITSPGIS